jgi:putative ABC transport system substrate-binding protein
VTEVQAADRAIGLQIQVFNADSSVDAAFETIGRERPDAIFVGVSPFLNGRRVQLAQLAAFHRLPAIYAVRDYAEVGGLMSYGSDVVGGFRQVGSTPVASSRARSLRICRSVQSSKFELVINLLTAKLLGLDVPPMLLARADEVIE